MFYIYVFARHFPRLLQASPNPKHHTYTTDNTDLVEDDTEAGQCSNPRKSKQSKQSTQILLSSRTLSPMVTVTSTS